MSGDHRAVVPIESNSVVLYRIRTQIRLKQEWAYIDIYSLAEPELLAFLIKANEDHCTVI